MVYIYIWVTQKYFIPFGSLNTDSLFIYSTCLFSWLTEDINETKLYFHVVFPLKCFLSLFRWEGEDKLQSGGKHLQVSSVAQSCPTLCDPMDYHMPGFTVHHQLPAQSHVHWVGDAIQQSHLLSSPSPPTFNLFSIRVFSHQVAKVLELQLQHQSFQWIFATDFLQDWLVWSPCSPRNSEESSPAPQFKSINSSALSLLYGPPLTAWALMLQLLKPKCPRARCSTVREAIITRSPWSHLESSPSSATRETPSNNKIQHSQKINKLNH